MTDKLLTLLPQHKIVALLEYKGQYQPVFHYPEGIYTKAVLNTFNQLDIMFSYHSKVTVILVQFHQANTSEDNKQVSQFIKKAKELIYKQYGLHRVAYAWAREHGELGNNQHYHVALMLNGSVCKSGYYLKNDLNRIAKSIDTGNEIWLPDKGTFRLHRYKDSWRTRTCRMRMSYAAKMKTKESIPKGVPKFGFSQLQANSRCT